MKKDKEMDFTGDELVMLYCLVHDHATDCGEFLDGDTPLTDLPREFLQERLRLANSTARKLRKILSDLGFDVNSLA